MQPVQPYLPPMTMPPQTAAAPYGGPMGPMPYGYGPVSPPRYGPTLSLVGTLLIGIGTLILAFALSSIGFGPGGGSYPNYTVGLWSPGFTIGTLLIGVGIILRGLGVFMTRPGPS